MNERVLPKPYLREVDEAPEVRVDPNTDPDAFSGAADAFRFSWMGQLYDQVVNVGVLTNDQRAEQGFDPLSHVPEGYEDLAGEFAQARSKAEVTAIVGQIDRSKAIRARRDARGMGSTLLSDLVPGILDPVNLVGGATVKGGQFLYSAGRTAIVAGTANVVTEGVRTAIDPLATEEEFATGAVGGYVIGGVFGGVASKIVPSARVAPPASAPPPTKRMPLPVSSSFKVGSGVGKRARPATRGGKRGSANHLGLDIQTPMGTPVKAQGVGEVIFAGKKGGYGYTVEVRFANGVETRVAHLSDIKVKPGDRVTPGQTYALTGASGNVSGAHLHYEMRVNGKVVDPRSEVGMEGAGEPRIPGQAFDVLEGRGYPNPDGIDGRGMSVVVTSGDAPAARFIRARTVGEIADDIADAETPLGRVDEPASNVAPADIWTGVESMSVAGRRQMAREWQARLKKGDADLEAQLGVGPKATIKVIETRIRETVVERVKAKLDGTQVQRAVNVADEGAAAAPVDAAARARMLDDRADEWEATLSGKPLPKTKAEAAARADMLEEIANLRRAARALTDEAGDGAAVGTRQVGVDAYGRPIYASADELDEGVPLRDSELAELARMDRQKRDNDLAQRGDIDDLPFGVHTTERPGDFEFDRIEVNQDALLRSWADKPWRNPIVEGVEPMDDALFPTPHDWLNFVVHHEVEHSVNPRLDGETTAAYENRINKRAAQLLTGDQQPFSLNKDWLTKAAVAPTPIAQLQRLVPDEGATIHRSLVDMASDASLQLARNKLGGATAPGGSVMQRAHRWIAEQYNIRDAIRRAYLEEIGQRGDQSRLITEARVIGARIPGMRPETKFGEFRREVARAIVGFEDVSPAAQKAAAAFGKSMQKVEAEARSLGLFSSQKGLRARADRLERQADKFRAMLDDGADADGLNDEIEAIVTRLDEQVADFRARADEPTMPHGEENYFKRQWNVDALLEKPDEIKAILRNGYIRIGHPSPDAAAAGAYSKLVADPSANMIPGSPSSLRHRELPVTNKEVFDFIDQDPELVASIYLRRMGAAIEMTRRFGDPAALDHVDELRIDLRKRGVKKEDAEQALQIFEDARDRIAGGFHGRDPMSWDNRTVRAIKNVTNLITMGSVIKSQVSDPARVMMGQGLGAKWLMTGKGSPGLLGGIVASITGDLSRFNPGGPAKLVGEALEIVTARTSARLIEADTAIAVSRETRLERGIASAQAPFFMANMLAPFTTWLKEVTGAVSMHNILDESVAVAAAIRAGEEPDAKTVARLAQGGIDTQMAQIIADMPHEQTPGGLRLGNVLAWEGERGQQAADAVLAAVQGEIRRGVVTPGPLDRPAIFDGVFHSKKGRQEALDEVARHEQLVEEARMGLRPFRNVDDEDPAKIAAVDALKKAIGELNGARRVVGQRGRFEAPLASLPFQLKSFAMASGPRSMAALMSDGERAKLTGVIAMLSAGVLGTWLKSSSAAWENMGYDELLAQSIDNTGLGAYLVDIGKGIDATFDLQTIPGEEFDPDGKYVNDEIGGALGPASGIAARLIEAFVVTEDDDEQGRMIRRSLPFNNLLWLKMVEDMFGDLFDEEAGGRSDPSAIAEQVNGVSAAPLVGGLVDGPTALDEFDELGRIDGDLPPIDALPAPRGKPKKPKKAPRKRKPALL